MRHSGLSRAPSGVPSSKKARRYHWPSQPAFSSRAARPARSLSHCRANVSSLMPARQRRELAQHFAQEEPEPDAFAAALVPDAIHAVVPVAGADQRQAVRAVAQPMLNRSPRMLVQARRFGRAPGHVVPRLLVRRHRRTVEETHLLVEHAGVVGRLHVPAQRERQPEVIVRNARPNAAPRRRMPPVLHVALDELSARAEQQVLAQQPRAGCGPPPSRPAAGRGSRTPRRTGSSRCGPTSGRRWSGTSASRWPAGSTTNRAWRPARRPVHGASAHATSASAARAAALPR